MEVHLLAGAEAEVYSYQNKENCEELVRYSLATGDEEREAFDLALAAWRGLGCRDGGRVDVRADAAGRLNFIEVNVLPGLHPEHSDLPILSNLRGLKYPDLIRQILESALRRLPSSRLIEPQLGCTAGTP
jgi:D-alanine-D-alanine ligase